MRFRALTLLALLVAFATEGEAQRTSKPRKKPFEALSQSAQRLKDSVAVRLSVPGFSVFDDSTNRDSLISVARSQLGARYVLGAEKPGKAFDCSGLVRFVMAALRIDLPRTAREQAQHGSQIERDVTHLRPGDLLTFGRGQRVTHIGIYIGEGRFVHASTTARRVVESSIDRPGNWYSRHWLGARRLLATREVADTVVVQ